MAYIPNEGVDMHGDADPGAFSSSNGILWVSLLLLNLSPLEVLFMSSPYCRYTGTTAACRQKIDPQSVWFASRGLVRRLRLVPRETRKSCKLEFPLPDSQRCLVKESGSKVCLFILHCCLATLGHTLALPFPVTRPPILLGNWFPATPVKQPLATCEAFRSLSVTPTVWTLLAENEESTFLSTTERMGGN